MGLKLQKTVKSAEKKEMRGPEKHRLPFAPPTPHIQPQTVRNTTHELTRQTHGADIANLNETAMAEAGSPVVHVDRRRED